MNGSVYLVSLCLNVCLPLRHLLHLSAHPVLLVVKCHVQDGISKKKKKKNDWNTEKKELSNKTKHIKHNVSVLSDPYGQFLYFSRHDEHVSYNEFEVNV